MAKAKRRRFLTEEQRQSFASEYLAGDSLSTIANRHGVCIYSVWKTLIQLGVPRRPTGGFRRCTLNEHVFDNAEFDPAASYFAGLLFADGCISRRRWGQLGITIGLSGEDGILVHKLRDFLETNRQLRIGVPQGGFPTDAIKTTLTVVSDHLAAALRRYGITERKSMTATVCEPMLFNRDWWRGVVDGDGWVTINEVGCPIIGVTGTRQTCAAFLAFARTVTPTKTQAVRLNSIWQGKVNQSHAYRVALALYCNGDMAMPRKHAVAEKIIALGKSKQWPTDAQSNTKRGPKPRNG